MLPDDAKIARLTQVREILCDADGNLFPSEEPAFVASAQVTNRFLAEYGCDRVYAPEELRKTTTGLNFRTTIVALGLANGIPVSDAEGLERWVEVEKQAVIDHLRTALRPDPQVLDPLTELAQHYGVSAVSSSADERIAACFEVTGLAAFFPPSRRFSAEDSLPAPTSKPDPAIYAFAGRRLGISTEQGLAVEDSVPGATSAVQAGFPTVGNLQFVTADERAERRAAFEEIGVLQVVESWTDVVALLTAARTATS